MFVFTAGLASFTDAKIKQNTATTNASNLAKPFYSEAV